ncbi:MAG: nucleotidyltransferase family protein [Lachnospiraceae bacterium]
MNLKQTIKNEILELAKKYQIQKVILFGSRARGDNKERSDIDLAVTGGNIAEFRLAVDEEVQTLLMFDVVNLDEPVQKPLLESIEKEGIVLYEKI